MVAQAERIGALANTKMRMQNYVGVLKIFRRQLTETDFVQFHRMLVATTHLILLRNLPDLVGRKCRKLSDGALLGFNRWFLLLVFLRHNDLVDLLVGQVVEAYLIDGFGGLDHFADFDILLWRNEHLAL